MVISLYPHQKEALDKLESGSILCGGVGSGKSRTAIAYYFCHECGGEIGKDGELLEMKNPKDLYIITTARKRDTCDWEDECSPFLLSTHEESCYWDVKVVVDSWNNIKKYVDVKDAFFIFDEQRVVGSGEWVKSFLKITKSNRWILLSATPGDTWSDYIPVFIANGFYRNKTEFIKRHIVYSRFAKYPKVERYLDTKHLEALRRKVVVPMEFGRHTKRHYIDILTDYDHSMYEYVHDGRWNPFDHKPIENAGELCLNLRKVVNSDWNRIEKIEELLQAYDRAIIFYNFDYELIMLRRMCNDGKIEHGEWNGHRHDPLPSKKKWVYLVQYTAGAEGWNCTKTNCIIFYSLNYSYKMMEQAAGRIDRLNTPYVDLYYYRLRSDSSIDKAIFSCLGKKQRFNENVFAGQMGFASKSCPIIEGGVE